MLNLIKLRVIWKLVMMKKHLLIVQKVIIYVITPAINKSFKFQSEWPGNSSQAYLLGSLVADIEKDKNVEVNESDDGYVIKASVNYPNNAELKYEKIYLNDDKELEKVEVYNDNDIVKIKVLFNTINMKAGLKESDFRLEDYVKEEENNNDVNNKEENNKENNSNNSNNSNNNENQEECTTGDCKDANNQKPDTENTSRIEDIIYPLYIPSNTYLTSSETVETDVGNRVILTFSGDKNFVLIEEATIKADNMEIVPVYGEPLLLTESIGALSANSLSWDANDISYYLASTELSVSEMQLIANSLGNTTLVANTK